MLDNVGLELPFILLLMAALGIRMRITPRASLFVNASPLKVFEFLAPYHGKVQSYGRTRIATEVFDEATRTYRFTYETTTTSGAAHSSNALFRLSELVVPSLLDWQREGLEGVSPNNQLLRMRTEITPEGAGARVTQTYYWGPRPMLALILARADLWGGMFRVKSLIETGVPSEWAYRLISAAVALVTGIVSLAAFSILIGWQLALVLIVALALHEFGHLLAYKLIGQPWGRIMFLPFLGAIAVPRLPFHRQGEAVFAALMGPGLSIVPAAAIALYAHSTTALNIWFLYTGVIIAGLNIFNLLPAEPLDGGMALRSVLAKLIGRYARFGLMTVGGIIAAIGYATDIIALLIFGGIAILANIKPRSIDTGLRPLSSLQVCIFAFSYVSIIAAYLTMFRYFLSLTA